MFAIAILPDRLFCQPKYSWALIPGLSCWHVGHHPAGNFPQSVDGRFCAVHHRAVLSTVYFK